MSGFEILATLAVSMLLLYMAFTAGRIFELRRFGRELDQMSAQIRDFFDTDDAGVSK